ncbi:hypothetical protein L6164_018997 [Bauhinia variegata]|uniref:Uncharacterized protein n=1 Tax=Bauhinia variegata TaxID=167791 RepID=A0ACB9NCT9_BAUVA|nr:hypothetical protein L6164_018997 [Bauhinia variegata]
MASKQFINSSNQVHNCCSSIAVRGFSKAQFCFFKILHIISSIPPSKNSEEEAYLNQENDDQLGIFPSRGIGFDLNIGLGSVEENGESESFAENTSDSSAIEVNRGGDEGEIHQEKSAEVSEATNAQVHTFGDDREETKFEEQISVESEGDMKGYEGCDGGGEETVPFAGKRHEGDNCLDLLIEAAKVISASSTNDDSEFEEASRGRELGRELRTRRTSHKSGIMELREPIKKGKQKWMVVDFYDEMNHTSPVVRSKRGRSQTLPHRYRDSGVEPLKRSRTSSTTTSSGKRLVES